MCRKALDVSRAFVVHCMRIAEVTMAKLMRGNVHFARPEPLTIIARRHDLPRPSDDAINQWESWFPWNAHPEVLTITEAFGKGVTVVLD